MNKESVKALVQGTPFLVATSSIVAAAAGATVTFVVLNQRIKLRYEELMNKEIEETKKFYAIRHKDGVTLDALALKYDMVPGQDTKVEDEEVSPQNPVPDTALIDSAAKIVEEQKYVSYDKPVGTAEVVKDDEEGIEVKMNITDDETLVTVKKNIFEGIPEVEEFDIDVELDKKHAGRPYILEAEEFFENESGYSQITCTYFEGDDILIEDQGDTILDETEEIGDNNLKFGCGSKDKNLVYIRNDQLEKEYEVARSNGSYATEVAGLKHSDDREPLRRMRDSD